MDDRVLTSRSQYCMLALGVIISSKDNDYKTNHSSSSFINSVVDWWLVYVYVHISIIHWYYSCFFFCFYHAVCTYRMLYSPTITYILYGRTMRTVQQIITLFTILLLFLLLLLIIIYNCVGYVRRNNNNGLAMLDNDDGWISIYLLNLFACMCPSVPPRIITTVLFPVYMYDWVMLLIVLYIYDGVMLVRMTWYTDEGSVTTISDDVKSILWIMCCPMVRKPYKW